MGEILIKNITMLISIALVVVFTMTDAWAADNLSERALDSVEKGVEIRRETQKNEARWFEDKKSSRPNTRHLNTNLKIFPTRKMNF